MKLEQQSVLTEFPEYTPGEENIRELVSNFCWNRNYLTENAQELGLNSEFLQKQGQTVLVGPFVGPGPIPTTFGGNPKNVELCNTSGAAISNALRQKGYTVEQAQLVTLATTEMPRKGPEMMDCLVLPKNQTTNQKARLVKPPEWKTPYCGVTMTEKDITQVQEPIDKMYGEYVRRKKIKRSAELLDTILQDVTAPCGNNLYVNYAQAFNNRVMTRSFPETPLPYVSVDLRYYQPFLEKGIAAVGRFVEVLDSIGFFEENPAFVKAVAEDYQVQTFAVEGIISEDDIMLRSRDNGSTITYRELMNAGVMVAPCKELSYLFTLGQMVPVVYGSENRGNFYRPYAIAKQQLEQLGLKPSLYRTQPRASDDINSFDTIYDYYQNIL